MVIQNIKKDMLLFFKSSFFLVEKANYKLVDMLEKLKDLIIESHGDINDLTQKAIFEFLTELNTNEYSLVEAVKEYSFAYAATCQQSVAKKVVEYKNDDLTYKYVIIDEAARANPRDLMIAMAQGKKIILVGDHRQLPHMYDEEIADQIADLENDEQTDSTEDIDFKNIKSYFEKSLFEYLFVNRLKTLEDKDKIQRRVTLNRQYRTHPMLGKFISTSFYEKYEQFDSGNEADFFKLKKGLPEKPVVWINVKGKRKKEGTSYTNDKENNVIIEKLKKYIDIDNSLTFGIISFYSAQINALKRELSVIPEFKQKLDDDEIEIGTVDSFQGKEFDIVFLSLVRTFPNTERELQILKQETNESKKVKRLYGFLSMANRLNVSMSRQKKLLIVVGDSDLVKQENDLAKQYIKGLVNFYELCENEGIIEN